MLHIGFTASRKKIYYLKIETWIDRSMDRKVILTNDDLMDAYCLMCHLMILNLRRKDARFHDAEEFAENYWEYLVKHSLWQELVHTRQLTVSLKFVEMGKKLALAEFTQFFVCAFKIHNSF